MLAHYLINVKKLSYDAALNIIITAEQLWQIKTIRSELRLYDKVCFKVLGKEWK
jgi:hypothetical protein